MPRQAGFDITAASEVMAVLALARDLKDLRARLGRIVVGYTQSGEPVTAEQLKAAGAAAVIMREALKPNLLQTLENTPVFVHAGPFGNIAHGNSSVVADLIGIHAGDFLVTEAGFGADMGAERFFNIKCRVSGLTPDAAVVVATVRALKTHSGKYRVVAGRPLPEACWPRTPTTCSLGAANLRKQLENIRAHGIEPVVAINAMPSDFPSERAAIAEVAASMGVRSAVGTHFADGGRGAAEIAEAVAEVAARPSDFHFLYPSEASLREKIEALATKIYGADGVDYAPLASRQLDRYERNGFGEPAGLHRQDAVLAEPRRQPQGRADRLPAPRPRGPRLGRGRLHLPDLRRHAHHARPGGQPGRRLDRPRRRRQHRRPVLKSQRQQSAHIERTRPTLPPTMTRKAQADGRPPQPASRCSTSCRLCPSASSFLAFSQVAAGSSCQISSTTRGTAVSSLIVSAPPPPHSANSATAISARPCESVASMPSVLCRSRSPGQRRGELPPGTAGPRARKVDIGGDHVAQVAARRRLYGWSYSSGNSSRSSGSRVITPSVAASSRP